jgi:O-antigen/teichoic acid export membrane protein
MLLFTRNEMAPECGAIRTVAAGYPMKDSDTLSRGEDQTPSEPSSVARSIAANSVVVGLCQVLTQVGGFLITLLLARHFGKASYGLLVFSFTYVEIFGVASVLGTNIVILREMTVRRGDDAASFWRSAMVLRVVLLAGAFGLAAALAFALFREQPRTMSAAIWASAGLIVSLRTMYGLVLRAKARAGLSYLVGAVRVCLYGGLVCCVVSFRGDIVAVIKASLLATIAGLVADRWLASPFLSHGGSADWRTVRRILVLAAPLTISSVLTIIQGRIDVLMLKGMIDDAAVGTYGVAMRITEGAYLIPQALLVSTFPFLVKAVPDTERLTRLFRNALMVLLAPGLAFVAVLSPIAKHVIVALFGSRYAASGVVLGILCWQIPLGYVNELLVSTLFAAEKQKLEVWASVVTTGVNVVGNVLLIPVFGVCGAAVATLLCQVAATITLGSMVVCSLRVRVPPARFLLLLASGLLCFGLTHALLLVVHWMAAGAIAMFVFGACAAALIGRQALTLLRSLRKS